MNEEHVAIQALAGAEARHRLILDTAQEGIWVTDAAGTTVFANPRMATILGTTSDVLDSATLVDFVSPGERPMVTASDEMSRKGEIRRYETIFVRPDGASRWVSVSSAPLHRTGDQDALGDAGPGIAEILHMVTDITERKHDEAELRRVTLHDDMTGLPNRRLLAERLAHHLEHEGAAPIAVLSVDIDNFKFVNDSLGHAGGDAVLTEVAERLRLTLRGMDTVARSGGDEFLVLSQDVADAVEAVEIAERLRASIHAPIRIGDTELEVTASVGIAMSPPDDAEDLIRGAGIAMYRVKEEGRDGVAIFDHRNEVEIQERVRIQTDLRRAIDNQEFEVWYQPIVGLDDQVVGGAEALLRWRHPTRGLLLPGAFMDVAESTGLIREIGRHVLETACTDASAWKDRGHHVRVTVNVAARQVVDRDLCAQVADILARTGMDPEFLTLEITESAAMGNAEVAEQNLHGLRALGIRLALDDFGTGYSSLSFLRRLPVTVVKIDQSFVAGIGERREDELIVAGVISMAHALGHTIIAEGIETARQRDALREMGCRYGQGFFWSRAVPLSELATTIDTIEHARGARPCAEPATAGPRPASGGRTGPELGASAFDALPTAAAVLDDNGVITATNRAWRLFATLNGGSLADTGVGVSYLAVCERALGTAGGLEGPSVAAGLREVLNGRRKQYEVAYQCPSPLQDRSFLMQGVANGAHGLVVSHTDISALEQIEPRFVLRGDGATLTTMPSTTLLEGCIDEMREDARRTGEPLAVLCCDLWGLPEVADALGGAAGAGVLSQVVARIARVVREGDIVARAGDSRLVIACPQLEVAERDAKDIAGRIEQVLATPFQLGAHDASISASVGYVTDDGRGSTDVLLEQARAATAGAPTA